jgi:hypothetical protein
MNNFSNFYANHTKLLRYAYLCQATSETPSLLLTNLAATKSKSDNLLRYTNTKGLIGWLLFSAVTTVSARRVILLLV